MPPRRPRILTSYLRCHYIHGTGDSNEIGLFGEGLWNSLGWDEVYVPFESVNAETIAAAKERGPYDAAFFMPYQDCPTWMRDVVGPNVPIICWVSDDQWRYDFTRTQMALADHFVTTHEPALSRYGEDGYARHVTLSAFGTRPDFWPNLVTRPEAALTRCSFVGLCYGERLARLRAIDDAADAEGLVPLVAHDTQRAALSLPDYHQHMADSAFTLALTSSSHGAPQHKARLFEPVLHGSVLVTEPAPLMPWTDDEAIIETTPKAMQQRMRALLDDPEAYQAMSRRAFRRALDESFQARFRVVLDALRLPVPMFPDFTTALDESPEGVDDAPDDHASALGLN